MLLLTRKSQLPASTGVKRMTIRWPPSQYAGNRNVRWRGERNSALSSTVLYGLACDARSAGLSSKTISQELYAGVGAHAVCAWSEKAPNTAVRKKLRAAVANARAHSRIQNAALIRVPGRLFPAAWKLFAGPLSPMPIV